jgi:L-rhamnose-H+ transport protein
MRHNHRWKWENTWLTFCTWSLLIFPWALVSLLITHVGELLSSLTMGDMAPALLFGFLWGIAQATFGVSIELLGVSVAVPVVSAIAIILGAFTPVAAQNPRALVGQLGLLLVISSAFLIAALVFYARASQMRETTSVIKKSTVGLLLAIFTGIFGGANNIGFALSGRIMPQSELFGNSPRVSTYVVWAVLLAAGFIPNFLYCLYLIRKNKTGKMFTSCGSMPDFLRSSLMGVFWILGTTLYGVSTTFMGKFGTSIGYLLYGSFTILFANVLGWKAGEWVGASPASQKRFWIGMGLVLGSVATLGFKL